MQKVQCLNVAKSFLRNNFLGSLKFLAKNDHWGNTFQDQLNVDFRDWMYGQVTQHLENKARAKAVKDTLCYQELTKIGKEKDPLKKRVQFALEHKAKSRQIESKDRRTIHFLFNPGVPSKISPFARNLQRFLEGTLEELEEQEKEKFEGYLQRLMDQELEEGETNPIEFGDMPFFHCDLTGGINRLCFSTADDPFQKTSIGK
jgi:hypothetical protein